MKITSEQTIETVFTEAESLIYRDREKTYGDPSKNLARIAELWERYLFIRLREFLVSSAICVDPAEARKLLSHYGNCFHVNVTDVCHMMQLLKWARDENHPKRDNVVDDLGYGGLVHRCREPEVETQVMQNGVEVRNNSSSKQSSSSNRKTSTKRKRK